MFGFSFRYLIDKNMPKGLDLKLTKAYTRSPLHNTDLEFLFLCICFTILCNSLDILYNSVNSKKTIEHTDVGIKINFNH